VHLHSENIFLVGKTTSRWGVPTLLFFLLTGILAGSEGIGGIPFDDPRLAESDMIFNLVFFIAVSSVLVNGTTLPFIARKLGLIREEGKHDPGDREGE
jgi:cell volume regulation protein A